MIYTEKDLEQTEYFQWLDGHIACFTHRSPDKSTPNEDSIGFIPYDKHSGVLVVADGLGGQPSGHTASDMAIKTIKQCVETAAQQKTPLRNAILDGFELANKNILSEGEGAATTLLVTEVQDSSIRSYHVGDSMNLLTGQRGRIKFQSISHSPVGYAVESGMLDEDDAVHHEERHLVSNVVGAEDMRIEIGLTVDMAQRDTLILASDGLYDNLYLGEVIDIIRKGDLLTAANRLTDLASQRMDNPDSTTPSHPDDLSFILYRGI